jgi:hypothetical protein
VSPEDSVQFASQIFRFPASRPDDVSYRPDAQLSKASAVRTTWIPVRTFLCVELRTAPACIRPNDSVARLDDPQWPTKPQDFFPKHRYGKIAATVRTTWIPVWTRSSIRQVSQFKSRRPDASQHGPDAQASDMEIACISLPDAHPPGPDARNLYMEITSSGRATVRMTEHHRPDAALKQERSSAKFLEFQSHSCLS